MNCPKCEPTRKMKATVTTADPSDMKPIWECPACKIKKAVSESDIDDWRDSLKNPRGDVQHKHPDSEMGALFRRCIDKFLSEQDKRPADLYRALGMQPYSYYRMFKTKGGPRIDRCIDVAKFFNVELHVFFALMPTILEVDEPTTDPDE